MQKDSVSKKWKVKVKETNSQCVTALMGRDRKNPDRANNQSDYRIQYRALLEKINILTTTCICIQEKQVVVYQVIFRRLGRRAHR